MMLTVNFESQLREAFAAGQAAATARFLSNKKGAAEFFKNTPQTYEGWIEKMNKRPSIMRG
jgi:hypothetical protein